MQVLNNTNHNTSNSNQATAVVDDYTAMTPQAGLVEGGEQSQQFATLSQNNQIIKTPGGGGATPLKGGGHLVGDSHNSQLQSSPYDGSGNRHNSHLNKPRGSSNRNNIRGKKMMSSQQRIEIGGLNLDLKKTHSRQTSVNDPQKAIRLTQQ